MREFDEKIIGGIETTIERYPYQVSLRFRNQHNCGGSILNPTRVLTAAHCIQPAFSPSVFSIMVGSTVRTGDANQQLRTLSRYIIHPEYVASRTINDIAVLHFVQPLTFGANVRPIRLPRQNATVPYGRSATVTGWGLTIEDDSSSMATRLKYTTVPLITNAQCNIPYRGRVTPDMVCAGLPEGGRDACQNDSGGPLVVRGVLVGVVSWGRGCGRPGFPGVYARVSHFTNWVRQNV